MLKARKSMTPGKREVAKWGGESSARRKNKRMHGRKVNINYTSHNVYFTT